MIGFGTAFGFGWLLHGQMDLIRALERRWLLNSVLAVVLIAASFFLAVATVMQTQPIGYSAIKLTGAACYALAIWTTTFAAIGAALRFLSGYSATRRYLADASYWLYLIHLPILMALQVAVCAAEDRSRPRRPKAPLQCEAPLPPPRVLWMRWRRCCTTSTRSGCAARSPDLLTIATPPMGRISFLQPHGRD